VLDGERLTRRWTRMADSSAATLNHRSLPMKKDHGFGTEIWDRFRNGRVGSTYRTIPTETTANDARQQRSLRACATLQGRPRLPMALGLPPINRG